MWALNFGTLSAATTSPLWAQSGLFASSTSHFVAFDFNNATGTSLALTGTTNSLLKTLSNGAVVAAVAGTDYANFGYLFPVGGYGTTTGLGIFGSTTIGNGAQEGGLTISGGATTTGNAYFGGNVAIGTTSPSNQFTLNFTGRSYLQYATTSVITVTNAAYLPTTLRFPNVGASSVLVRGGNHSLTLTTTAATNATFPNGTITLADLNTAQTFSGEKTFSASTTIAGVLNAVGGAAFGNATVGGTFTLSSLSAGGLALNSSGVAYTFATSSWTFASSTLLSDSNTFSGSLNQFTGNLQFANATSTTFAISGISSDNLVKTSTGGALVAAVAGTDYVTGAGLTAAFPFTQTTFGSTNANATSTLIGFTQGIYSFASSTIGNGAQEGGLTISGGATTTGTLVVRGSQIIAPDGTAALPGVSFSSNNDLGIYRSANNTLGFSSAGVLRFTIASGQFAANTSTGPVIVNTGASVTTPNVVPNKADTTTGFNSGTTGNLNVIVSGTEISRWTSTGLGMSTTSPWARLSVDTTSLLAGVPSFVVGSSTRTDFVITQLGNVGIATTTPGSIFAIQNAANFVSNATSTIYNGLEVRGNLNITGSATSTFANGIQLSSGCFLLPSGQCAGTGSDSGSGGGTKLAAVYSTSTPGSNVQVVLTGTAGSAPSFSAGVLTLPSDTVAVVVEVWGGGGGGGSGNSASTGGAGGSSCFGTNATACTSPTLSATGGALGGASNNGAQDASGGGGGTGSGGDINLVGGPGGNGGAGVSGSANGRGGTGGSAPRGGGGGQYATAGAVFGGGGSGGISGATGGGGGGGGGGGYSQKVITTPSGTYYYTVGVGGALGGNGLAGGAGGFAISVYTASTNATIAASTIAGQMPYFAAVGTTSLTATSSIFLSSKGNFGIGSTTPFAKLSVHAGSLDAVNQALFAVGSSTASATTTHFVVTNAGNVGVGTSSPTFSAGKGLYVQNSSGVAESVVDGSTYSIFRMSTNGVSKWHFELNASTNQYDIVESGVATRLSIIQGGQSRNWF